MGQNRYPSDLNRNSKFYLLDIYTQVWCGHQLPLPVVLIWMPDFQHQKEHVLGQECFGKRSGCPFLQAVSPAESSLPVGMHPALSAAELQLPLHGLPPSSPGAHTNIPSSGPIYWIQRQNMVCFHEKQYQFRSHYYSLHGDLLHFYRKFLEFDLRKHQNDK